MYSTYLGGSGDDAASEVVVDSDGNAYLAGYTLSTEFPVSADALQKTFAGFGGQGLAVGGPGAEGAVNTGDAFVLKLDAAGRLLYSSFFGGSADDIGMSLAIDSARNIYVGGVTMSGNLTTASPVQASYGGAASLFPRGDAFFAKFDFGGKLAGSPAKLSFVDIPTAGVTGGVTPVTVLVSDAANAPLAGVPVSFTAVGATLGASAATSDAQGKATVQATLGAAGTATLTATVAGLPALTANITVQPAGAVPVIGGVVNGASFLAPIAPGSWVTIGGSNLSAARADATAVPLPATLGGVRVRINNSDAPLLFVIDGQINLQIPFEVAPGNATVTVIRNGVSSAPFPITVLPAAPGIFLYNGNRAVAQNVADDGSVSLNTPENPVGVSKLMLVYFTGQGALDVPVASGAAAGVPLSRPVASYSVTIGGKPVTPDFVGMTPGNIALGQANVRIPELESGEHPVVITIGGQASNAAMISVRRKE
ncbi:SBBP repeat-containing protein [Bryobacter aggregatus]|uniref:SBBP repeat-containing protein n=1 Tax=Bryobacter aggregatus TaxID=360054 RepID=UPI0012BA93B5|nr:SBBP repeat-containing protein [Bryobacter aggregatus]